MADRDLVVLYVRITRRQHERLKQLAGHRSLAEITRDAIDRWLRSETKLRDIHGDDDGS